jgi:hypothetical protein
VREQDATKNSIYLYKGRLIVNRSAYGGIAVERGLGLIRESLDMVRLEEEDIQDFRRFHVADGRHHPPAHGLAPTAAALDSATIFWNCARPVLQQW